MSDNTPAEDERSPWTQPRFIASALIVGLVVVLGVVLVVTGPSDTGSADSGARPDAGTPASSAPRPRPDAAASGSACGLSGEDQTIPRSAPPATQWELVGSIATPVAPKTHGPGRKQSGLRHCFAHTPTGALFAGVNFVAATSTPRLRERAARELTASGPGRERAIREAEGSQTASDTRVQVVGFTFLNYAKDTTTVDLAFRATRSDGTTGLVHMPVSLRWEDGDWKAHLSATGDVFPGIGPIPDLTGYVPWGVA